MGALATQPDASPWADRLITGRAGAAGSMRAILQDVEPAALSVQRLPLRNVARAEKARRESVRAVLHFYLARPRFAGSGVVRAFACNSRGATQRDELASVCPARADDGRKAITITNARRVV